MKKSKEIFVQADPTLMCGKLTEGSKKSVIKYAYLPTKMGTGEYIWFGKYLQMYECIRYLHSITIVISPTDGKSNSIENYDFKWIKKGRKYL